MKTTSFKDEFFTRLQKLLRESTSNPFSPNDIRSSMLSGMTQFMQYTYIQTLYELKVKQILAETEKTKGAIAALKEKAEIDNMLADKIGSNLSLLLDFFIAGQPNEAEWNEFIDWVKAKTKK